jgi:hypothetical protein
MIDWPVAFSTVSQALKLTQELRAIDKQLGEADLRLKIAELTSALAELKLTLTEAKAEAVSKDDTIEQLKKVNRRVAVTLTEHRGYLYRKQPDNDKRPAGNPHCPVCLEKEGLLFETTYRHVEGRPLQCLHCGGRYDNVQTFIN